MKDDKDTSYFDKEFTGQTVMESIGEEGEKTDKADTDFEKYYEDMFQGFSFYNANFDY